MAREGRVSVGKGVEALQWPWGLLRVPGALEVLQALGDFHVQVQTVQSALQHCLGVPFVAPSRLQRRGGGDAATLSGSALCGAQQVAAQRRR